MYGFTVPLSGTPVSNIANLYPYKLILCQYKLAMLLRNLVGDGGNEFCLGEKRRTLYLYLLITNQHRPRLSRCLKSRIS